MGGNEIEPELMCHVSVLVNWKHFLCHRGCEKDDRLVFSLASIRGATRLKKNSKVTCRSQEKTTKTEWKGVENAVYWIFLDRPQKKT